MVVGEGERRVGRGLEGFGRCGFDNTFSSVWEFRRLVLV